MTYKEVYDIAMPEKKRREERFNIWVTIAVRPLSVLLTIPFVETNVKPITITKWSIIANLAGFLMISFGHDLIYNLIGWMFFFIWAVLDGVDGNLARCTSRCSPLGDLWDTMGGYIAMILIYFSAGIASFYGDNYFDFCDKSLILIFGGMTAVISIFPRLIMHKRKSTNIDDKVVKAISDKQSFNLSKILAMNLVSPSGFMQIIFLASIIFNLLNYFVAFYFAVNLFIMIISLKGLLKE